VDRDTVDLVRPARAEDVAEIARIEVETWRTTYAGMLPDRVLVGMSEHRQRAAWQGLIRYRPDDVMVVERPPVPDGLDPGGVIGFGNCGVQRDSALPYAGEIYTIYVDPPAQNQGVGKRLLRSLFERLLEKGRGSALIWVIRANPSRYFYERQGGKLVLTRKIRIGGVSVDAVAYGWRDLAALVRNEG
jgi:ribosomal protein S18 acetylase RimI-like enzyme